MKILPGAALKSSRHSCKSMRGRRKAHESSWIEIVSLLKSGASCHDDCLFDARSDEIRAVLI
jgi:hypothetical protein